MKKIVQLMPLLLSIVAFSQRNEIIQIGKIKDKSGMTKSLTVIDSRNSKDLGAITSEGEIYHYSFSKTELKEAIEEAFSESNKNSGKNDIALLIKDLSFFNDKKSPEVAKAKIDIAIFFKRNDKYFFIDRTEGVISADRKEGNVAKTINNKVSKLISQLILNSYNNIAVSVPLNETTIMDYEPIIKNTYPAYKTESLTPGVYLSFKSFIQQKPIKATYRRDKDGDIKGVNDGVYDIRIDEIYSIVEDNKIYKAIPIGYREVFKDEKGWYINVAPSDLFVQSSNGMMIGAMTGGMVGALIGAAIDSGNRNAGNAGKNKTQIYLDPLTGGYVFRE